MRMLIYCGKAVSPEDILEPAIIEINSGRIERLYHVSEKCSCRFSHKILDSAECDIYLPQAIAVPGFVDIHIHGAFGCDTMDATPEAMRAISGFLPKNGVTSFLPTTITAPWPDLVSAVENAAAFEPSALPS